MLVGTLDGKDAREEPSKFSIVRHNMNATNANLNHYDVNRVDSPHVHFVPNLFPSDTSCVRDREMAAVEHQAPSQ